MEYKVRRTIELIKASGLLIEVSECLNKLATQSLIESEGGQIQMLERIKEAQQRGVIDKVRACKWRNEVEKACQETGGQTAQSETIEELDRKVAEAVRCYRLGIAQHPKGEGASNL